ncbi:hypothetical protein EPO33_02075 [Patescibacteria group bacterium]|nr:MAG: hypothetical protein EPO33_02075 [Patescibacteria group bacterium]
MVENLEYSPEELYGAVRERAEAEGVTSQEQWDDMVEVVLNEKVDWAEVEDDDNISQLRDDLRSRYADYKRGAEKGAV